MEKGTREQNIKRIINMEDRIVKCNRCPSLTRCVRKPSLGKGDLEPQLLMVFECDTQFTMNRDEIIKLRDKIKKNLETERVYYTFMTRCQPKACAIRQNANCYMSNKLLDKDYKCLLSNMNCEGIPVKPSVETHMNCLPFLMEEIEILNPKYVVLFGSRVGDYVLKSYGIFEKAEVNTAFEYEGTRILISVEENQFSDDSAIALRALL